MTKARDFFRASFLGVPSMNDSLGVEVLFPATERDKEMRTPRGRTKRARFIYG